MYNDHYNIITLFCTYVYRTVTEDKQRQDNDNRSLQEKLQKLETQNATMEKVWCTKLPKMCLYCNVCIGINVSKLQDL